jgi:ABC-type taurine transport system ATPase subunit
MNAAFSIRPDQRFDRQRVLFDRTVATSHSSNGTTFSALDAVTRVSPARSLADALERDPADHRARPHDVEEAVALAGCVIVMSPRPGRSSTRSK